MTSSLVSSFLSFPQETIRNETGSRRPKNSFFIISFNYRQRVTCFCSGTSGEDWKVDQELTGSSLAFLRLEIRKRPRKVISPFTIKISKLNVYPPNHSFELALRM